MLVSKKKHQVNFFNLLIYFVCLKADIRFIMVSIKIDFSIPFKQDITQISKIIEKV